jgi:pyrroline-5-carboxylate reductase
LSDKIIGIIGLGNMGTAIAEGFIGAGISSNKIIASGRDLNKLNKKADNLGIVAATSNEEVADKADIIIIAVIPSVIEETLNPIKEQLQGKLVVSVVSRYFFEEYEQLFTGLNIHHISTIPNTPVAVGEGIFVCEKKHNLSDEEFGLFKDLFSKIALLQFFDTNLLEVATVISGCAPAFADMFIEALGDAGVTYGLTRNEAYSLAAQMLVGSGKLRNESRKHPGELKDLVTSPGGTTIRGVNSLEEDGFRGTIIRAVKAIVES